MKNPHFIPKQYPHMLLSVLFFLFGQMTYAQTLPYPVVDTHQQLSYSNNAIITAPQAGQPFYGQDAQHAGHQPSYTVSSDSLTVLDNVSGLTWQRAADTNGDGVVSSADKLTFAQAMNHPAALNSASHGGFTDWRLPTIKELYSLMDFRGTDPSGYNGTDTKQLIPFLDQAYFGFCYGDPAVGERIIDAQYASSTLYTSTTMGGSETMFGVNFADGRIKGYPKSIGAGGRTATYFVLCVRGNTSYGINDFLANGDGTVTDRATGLMWSQSDGGVKLNWQEALAWAAQKNSELYLGHDDWRLPDVKELQSILDYTRAPNSSNSPAIDPVFDCTSITNEAGEQDYPCYWSSTTHAAYNGNGSAASYVAFGRGMGYMNGRWIDVHGAGCQRSDPKAGDPANYPQGRGPQGDAIRIYNYLRLVRDASATTGMGDHGSQFDTAPASPRLEPNYPNPFRESTMIEYTLPAGSDASLRVYDTMGRHIATLVEGRQEQGKYSVPLRSPQLAPGFYTIVLRAGREQVVRTMILR